MKYLKIKDTNLEISNIGYGTSTTGLRQTQEEANELLSHYVQQGGNYIDTASMYSDWVAGEKSRSEKTIGRWLKDYGKRDQYYIGTKGGHPGFGADRKSRINKKEIAFDMDNSLANLNTDYIDIYWLHRDDADKSTEEILLMMEEFVQSGKIKYYACSNWTMDRIKDAQKTAKEKGFVGFIGNQIEWSATKINQESIRDKSMLNMNVSTLDYHNESQLAVFAYTSQASGLYDRILEGGYDNVPDFMQNKFFNDETKAAAELIIKYAKDAGITPNQCAVAYLHSRKDNFKLITLAGTNNISRLDKAIQASEIELPKDLVAEISKALY